MKLHKYQFILALGLDPKEVTRNNGELYVNARQLEKILRDAPEVWGYAGPGGEACKDWELVDDATDPKRALTGRLLCIRPIEPDTPKKLLQEILYVTEHTDRFNMVDLGEKFIERAKKLVEGDK